MLMASLSILAGAFVWTILDGPAEPRREAALASGPGDTLPPLSELESELVARRLRQELDVEAFHGAGDGHWDVARHARAIEEARLEKARRAQRWVS
jgi:hypothetical protein